MALKAAFHVNHLWGLGHFSRIAALANAVVAQGGAATILSGNTPLAGRMHDTVEVVPLDPIRARDPSYRLLVDAAGRPPDDALWQRRAGQIAEALERRRPDVLVTETFPLGRRKLSPELLQCISAAKTRGAAIVCSLRDIPTPPRDPARLDECAARLRDFYDAVLVHGDPHVIDLAALWPGDIPAPVHATGYVVDATPIATGPRNGVIVSAGGGGDATALVTAALAARKAGLLADEAWTIVTGPQADRASFDCAAEGAGVSILQQVPDLPHRIARARLSISRGGYNTVLETVAAGTSAVIVPAIPFGEVEQAIRAAQFAERGYIVHLPEMALTPHRLAEAARQALASRPPGPNQLNLNGAAHSAALLAEIAEAR